MLNCYCQLSSSVIFRQYGVSQSECKIDRPRPGLPRVSPRPHTEALGTRLGISADWIRFENMFASQIDSKSISDAEKFEYLLELVNPKVRGRLSNLNPGSEGYKTAWERLKMEYGHNKLVIAAHMEEIINLQTVRGRNYDKVCQFYETLCKKYDALQTLGEEAMLKGLVVSTLSKLPQVKPDLVRIDDDWEYWNMK